MLQDQQRELEAVKQEKIKMERELTRQENTGRHLLFALFRPSTFFTNSYL
jgi:hypothetical protein